MKPIPTRAIFHAGYGFFITPMENPDNYDKQGTILDMAYYVLKVVITTALVVLISEITKRSSFIGALLASVPFSVGFGHALASF